MGQLIDLGFHRTERERLSGAVEDEAAMQDEAVMAAAAAGRTGRVLLFTGVRYERMDAEPVRERAEA